MQGAPELPSRAMASPLFRLPASRKRRSFGSLMKLALRVAGANHLRRVAAGQIDRLDLASVSLVGDLDFVFVGAPRRVFHRPADRLDVGENGRRDRLTIGVFVDEALYPVCRAS